MIRTYTELIALPTFHERFEYLKIGNGVGHESFGWRRYLNQALYHSPEWRRFRSRIITRDLGCDLGCRGFEITEAVIIHHLNPITYAEAGRKAFSGFL